VIKLSYESLNMSADLRKGVSMMNKKSNILKLFGIIALVAVINLGLAGCKTDADDDGGGGGGGSIPTELVGTWGKSGQTLFVIKADGSGTWGDPSVSGVACTWSVSGNRLTFSYSGASGSIEYSVSGNKLTLSGTADGTLAGGWTGIKSYSPLEKI
jgi:hypothetical protein